jgi:hypothetical protein
LRVKPSNRTEVFTRLLTLLEKIDKFQTKNSLACQKVLNDLPQISEYRQIVKRTFGEVFYEENLVQKIKKNFQATLEEQSF